MYSSLPLAKNLTAAEAGPLLLSCCLQRAVRSGEMTSHCQKPAPLFLCLSRPGMLQWYLMQGCPHRAGPGAQRVTGLQCKVKFGSQEEQRAAPKLGQPSQHTAHPSPAWGIVPFQMRSLLYWALVNEGDRYMCYLCWHKSIINKYKVHSLTICSWC